MAQITGDIAVLYDITAEKRAEEALQASEALFRAAFDQAAVGMAHVSLEGRYLRVNRRFCEIAGYSEAELLERDYREITHPGDLEGDDDCWRRLIENLCVTHTREKRYVRKDGSAVWAAAPPRWCARAPANRCISWEWWRTLPSA